MSRTIAPMTARAIRSGLIFWEGSVGRAMGFFLFIADYVIRRLLRRKILLCRSFAFVNLNPRNNRTLGRRILTHPARAAVARARVKADFGDAWRPPLGVITRN